MAKPINIRAVAEGVRGPVADTEKAIVRFSKFIRRNDSKLRNFKFPLSASSLLGARMCSRSQGIYTYSATMCGDLAWTLSSVD